MELRVLRGSVKGQWTSIFVETCHFDYGIWVIALIVSYFVCGYMKHKEKTFAVAQVATS